MLGCFFMCQLGQAEVVGIVIVNSDGACSLVTGSVPILQVGTYNLGCFEAPIRTTLDKKQTEQYAELVSQLAAKADRGIKHNI